MIEIAPTEENLALIGIILGLVIMWPWIVDTVRTVIETFTNKEKDL